MSGHLWFGLWADASLIQFFLPFDDSPSPLVVFIPFVECGIRNRFGGQHFIPQIEILFFKSRFFHPILSFINLSIQNINQTKYLEANWFLIIRIWWFHGKFWARNFNVKMPETELMNQMQTEKLKQKGAMTNKNEPRFENLVLLHAFKIPSYFFRYISGAKRTALTVLRVDFNRWPIAFCIVSTYKNTYCIL